MSWVDTYLGQGTDYIELALPLFLLLIVIEIAIGFWQKRRLYRLHDSITDVTCGILDQIVAIFMKGLLLAAYLYLYEHVRLLEIQRFGTAGKWLAAGVLFLGVDFCFYWFHRFSHEWALPWGAHAVHHQSEEFNLAVALRQSATEGCFAWVFYLPLAVMGFPPPWYLAMASLNLIYQFWIHTRVIGKLGPLERVLNTPSHHRVHHGRNPKYLDKNYAGALIIWDRLFGTFHEEEEEPVYGLTKPLESWNPLWAHLHVWAEMLHDARRAPRWRDKVKIWFMPLGWLPEGLPAKSTAQEVSRATNVNYHTPLPRGLNAYTVIQFSGVLVLSLLIGQWEKSWSLLYLAVPALLVLYTAVNLGGILERRRWALNSEMVRLAGSAFIAAAWAVRLFSGSAASAAIPTLGLAPQLAMTVAVGIVLADGVSLVWLWAYRAEFQTRPVADQPSESNTCEPATGDTVETARVKLSAAAPAASQTVTTGSS
jgi:sterol desaturase/sphingolipid hydroxylase (fatty acid hydroxylase superfamily)